MSFETLAPWLIAYLGIGFGICVFLTAWDIASGETRFDDHLDIQTMLATLVGWGVWVSAIAAAHLLLLPMLFYRRITGRVSP